MRSPFVTLTYTVLLLGFNVDIDMRFGQYARGTSLEAAYDYQEGQRRQAGSVILHIVINTQPSR